MNPGFSFRYCMASLVVAGFGTTQLHAADAGDYNVAYSFAASSDARTAAPSAASTAGIASFGLFATPHFLVAGSTQTFTSETPTGSSTTWGYGVTKLEFNQDFSLSQKTDLQGDYTIVLPTNHPNTSGNDKLAHQFLGMLDYQHSAQNYFEVDAGDYLSGRSTGSGYQNTPLLSLIASHNTHRDGKSSTNLDFELDASPAAGESPSSLILTAGADHTFGSRVVLTALAQIGLTANDPAIGVSISVKILGKLTNKSAEPSTALTFSKLQRLQERFGKIGRF